MFLFCREFCAIKNIFGIIKTSVLHARSARNMSSTNNCILYGDIASPPVRFAMITGTLLNVKYEFCKVDLFKGENKLEWYKKINSLQKVPALSVNNEVICDSHAIALYFCRYNANNDLYPEDTILRTKIDELMYFHASVLFPTDSAIFTDFFARKWSGDEVMLNKWYSALDFLELKLNDHMCLTGDKVRLCDICCGTTVSSLEILVPLSERHTKVRKWLKNLKSLSCFDINNKGLDRLQRFVTAVGSKHI